MAILSSLRNWVASISRAIDVKIMILTKLGFLRLSFLTKCQILFLKVYINPARYPILFTGVAYFLSMFIGMIMVHAGNKFALDYRDRLVNQSLQSNPASVAYVQGNHFQAALWDFAENLVLGAFPKTVSGLSVLLPYPMVI